MNSYKKTGPFLLSAIKILASYFTAFSISVEWFSNPCTYIPTYIHTYITYIHMYIFFWRKFAFTKICIDFCPSMKLSSIQNLMTICIHTYICVQLYLLKNRYTLSFLNSRAESYIHVHVCMYVQTFQNGDDVLHCTYTYTCLCLNVQCNAEL